TLNWTGGILTLSNGGTLNNRSGALLDMKADVTANSGSTTGGTPQIINNGTLKKSAGTGQTRFSVNFNNLGTVEERSGNLLLFNPVTNLSGSTLTGGTWIIGANAQLRFNVSFGTTITTNAATITL